jgi:ABC-type branched-subunit amino acid transport system permease subunit
VGELVDRDQEHLALLKLGFYIMAGLAGFCSLFSLIYIAMGGFFVLGFARSAGSSADPRFVGLLILCVGVGILLLGVAITLLTYFAGRSLGERRHRIFCMVVAALLCLSVPFGTVLGVSAIIVLNRRSVEGLFEAHSVPPAFPPPSVP